MGAYGSHLKLLRTGGAEAFGFQWRTHRDVVEIRADEKWLEKFEATPGIRKKSGLYGARQCVRGKIRRGVLKGVYLRLLDCTNAEEDDVLMMRRRMTIGLLEAGHSKTMLRAALEGVQGETVLPLRRIQ